MTEARTTYTFSHDQMRAAASDLTGAVLQILQAHVGAHRAIRAGDIARALGQHSDRAVREGIRQLRRDGHLILSSVGDHPGYYLAADVAEWREFRDRNLRPRAIDILETVKAMSSAAGLAFGAGDALQMTFDL